MSDPIEQLLDALNESTRLLVRSQDSGVNLATSVMVNFLGCTPDHEEKFNAFQQKELNVAESGLVSFCYSKALMLLLSRANYPNEHAAKIDQTEAWFVENWMNPMMQEAVASLASKMEDPLIASVVAVICARLSHLHAVKDIPSA